MAPRYLPRIVPLLALLAVAAAVLPPTPAQGGSSAAALKSRVDTALRGIGASHVDYVIEDSAIGAVRRHAATATAPASNEKLFTAIAALHLLSPGFRYATQVRTTAPIVNHTIDGDLILVGAGDPTLTFGSLLAMAKRLHALGLRHVSGHLLVDDSRYSHRTIVSGWKHKFVPEETGTVDAFSLDGNQWRHGKSFVADPTPYNAAIWRKELRHAHITVARRTTIQRTPPNTLRLLTHHSATLGVIIAGMLRDSVNFYAEMILREIGAFRSGHGGPATGVAAVRATARDLKLPLGTVHDGSGLSYTDRASPATITAWLDRIKTTTYYNTVYSGLPLSCTTGTLKGRLCGPNVRGRIRAKTGTLNHVSTLSGYLTTNSGHTVTFSILVSGFPDSQYGRIYRHVDAALAQVSIHG
jgi:D-alanyl-D-alanine carboxypeptidase/D-alanyl-D-alanine-endopeptidase (penicillin-binding protein 4)